MFGENLVGFKDVGCRSNFDPSRPLYTQDTSFSVKSSLTAVRQGAKVPSSDIFGCVGFLAVSYEYKITLNPRKSICCGKRWPKSQFKPNTVFAENLVGLSFF